MAYFQTLCRVDINPRVRLEVQVAAGNEVWTPAELYRLARVLTWISNITARWQLRGKIESKKPEVKK